MRRYKIVAQIILLILSVINTALAAPVLSVREIAKDVTTTSGKRWNPSYEWWTNSADRTKTPPRLGLSDSDYRLEQELRPHGSRSPMDPNASPHSQPSPGTTDSDDSHPLSQPSPLTPPVSSLSADSDNSPPHSPPSPGSTDLNNFHPLPAGSPPPAHDNLPDLNDPQPIEEQADSSNFGSYEMGAGSKSDSNPPPPQDIVVDRPLSPRPTDDQPPLTLPSDSGSSKRPSSPPDPGPSKRPYNPSESTWTLGLSDPGASTSALGTTNLGPEPSTSALGPSDPGPRTRPYRPLNPGPSTSDPGMPIGPFPWPDSESDDSYPGSSTPDPGPSTSSDPGPSIPHSPSGPGPLQHESEIYFSELFRGRLKRRLSGSRSVNAAQRELQGTLDSTREYASASAFPLPPTFRLP
jgi:hypothetical protein